MPRYNTKGYRNMRANGPKAPKTGLELPEKPLTWSIIYKRHEQLTKRGKKTINKNVNQSLAYTYLHVYGGCYFGQPLFDAGSCSALQAPLCASNEGWDGWDSGGGQMLLQGASESVTAERYV